MKKFLSRHADHILGVLSGFDRIRAGRPVEYLSNPQTNKEELVQKVLRDPGVGRHGVVAIFSSVDVCQSYQIRRDRERKRIELWPARRKCLHHYVCLSPRPAVRPGPRADTNLVSTHHARCDQRPGVAGSANGRRRLGLSAGRQLLPLDRGF